VTTSVLVTDFAWPSLETERAILAGIGAELVTAETGDEDELSELARDADAILTNWKPVTARVLESAPRCLTVARYGVGLDNIDVETATTLGIVVSNVRDYCIDEVSDHALALVLALSRRLVDFATQTRSGGWDNQAFGTMHRLRGQTLGLVGFGRIARRVAQKAEAFGMSVSAYAPRLREGGHDGVHAANSLDELLSDSDIISLHAPLNRSTHHMIGARQLERMRPGAMLVNTARGALIDEDALCQALENGTLGAAGLDVMDEEPPPRTHRLRSAPRVLLTPHAAFYSAESVHELQEKAASNVANVLSGILPATTVNPEVLKMASLRADLGS
jgi:D-3-phosphoglycerate dehydrogenase / 2-oxoglutarate reductase